MPRKIVCDTNTLISGFLWLGNEFKLLSFILEGKAVLFSPPALFSEFMKVLAYERLRPFVADPPAIVEKLKGMAVFIDPKDAIHVVKDDPSDNRVLECAIACNADFIVSGDRHLLALRSFEGIPILTTKQALEKI